MPNNFTDRGVSLTRAHLRDELMLYIERLSPERQHALSFKNNITGYKFVSQFEQRHH